MVPTHAIGLAAVRAKTAHRARPRGAGRFRLFGPAGDTNYYHVVSRTVGGSVFFDDVEKEALRILMGRLAHFGGLRLLTYCVMGNHFHAVVQVPDRDGFLARFSGVSGEERLLDHLHTLYSASYVKELRQEIRRLREEGRGEEAVRMLDSFRRRMCDVVSWAKELKERFSRWFNRRHERKGTLWMERFRSVLLENGDALRTVVAYVDRNPVRAGMVADARDYRWSGFAEACMRPGILRESIHFLVRAGAQDWNWMEAREHYAVWLAQGGPSETHVEGSAGPTTRRLRSVSRGLALGSRAWVEQVFRRHRHRFGEKRRSGARPSGGKGSRVFALRDLDRPGPA